MLKTLFTTWDPVLATVVAVAAFIIFILLLKPWRWLPEKEEPRHRHHLHAPVPSPASSTEAVTPEQPNATRQLQPPSPGRRGVPAASSSTVGPDVPIGPSPASPESPEVLWRRARQMPHAMIPDPILDREYLALVHASAESGCIPALAKLGDYAFRRRTFVEAYFWTKLAEKRLQLLKEADPRLLEAIQMMLREIRRRWAQTGRSPEFENVHEAFPPERADLGRAFLQMDSGYESWRVRQFIRDLAQAGNPDAALFA